MKLNYNYILYWRNHLTFKTEYSWIYLNTANEGKKTKRI